MRVATLGKKTSGLQQKTVEVKIKKNKNKAPGNGEGAVPVGHLSILIRAQVAPSVENEETFMNRGEVKDS